MSKDWVQDIHDMHAKYGVDKWVSEKIINGDTKKLQAFLKFRLAFLDEELTETINAAGVKDPEEIVDCLIDLCVVAIGTLDSFGIDAYQAWDRVHAANMAKAVGVKESRPNPLGLPDLIKPKDWKAPDHSDNHGYLPRAFK